MVSQVQPQTQTQAQTCPKFKIIINSHHYDTKRDEEYRLTEAVIVGFLTVDELEKHLNRIMKRANVSELSAWVYYNGKLLYILEYKKLEDGDAILNYVESPITLGRLNDVPMCSYKIIWVSDYLFENKERIKELLEKLEDFEPIIDEENEEVREPLELDLDEPWWLDDEVRITVNVIDGEKDSLLGRFSLTLTCCFDGEHYDSVILEVAKKALQNLIS
jgi:hypothetical protein